jgi:hypothetical protein
VVTRFFSQFPAFSFPSVHEGMHVIKLQFESHINIFEIYHIKICITQIIIFREVMCITPFWSSLLPQLSSSYPQPLSSQLCFPAICACVVQSVWRQQLSKTLVLSPKLHSDMSQKTVNLVVIVRPPNLTLFVQVILILKYINVLFCFFQRKRKLEVQNGFPCKKLFPEDKTAMLR